MTGNSGFINTTAENPLEFGQFYAETRPYSGLLDDVRVYNRDLSGDEVQQLYQFEWQGGTVPSPRTARATGSVSHGFFIGTTIVDPGYGYTNVPGVHILGVGTGAQAVAVVSNGVVTAINILNAGSGYTNAPQVIIDPPVMLTPVLNLQPMSFLVFSNLTLGTNYQLQNISSNTWVNVSSSFAATNSVYSQMVTGLPGLINYRLAALPLPVRATATAQLINGFVVAINITAGGSGYTAAPTVQITDKTGSGASATAKISGAGVVTNITVNAAGSGYTAPSVVISAPTASSNISPRATPVMRLDCSQLFPFTNCQVQVSSNLAGAWNNWSSGLFVPTATTNSLFWFATNNAALFRLKYLP
jgi:hypothetical protein